MKVKESVTGIAWEGERQREIRSKRNSKWNVKKLEGFKCKRKLNLNQISTNRNYYRKKLSNNSNHLYNWSNNVKKISTSCIDCILSMILNYRMVNNRNGINSITRKVISNFYTLHLKNASLLLIIDMCVCVCVCVWLSVLVWVFFFLLQFYTHFDSYQKGK